MNTFIQTVLKNIPVADNDIESVRNHVTQLYQAGFNVEDARTCIRASEEVNPELDEDKALSIMNKLWSKYGNRKELKCP